jgi:hypothetical protein
MIIVLVAVVVIFVITVGIGGCHDSGSGRDPDDAGAVGTLKGLRGKRFLRLGDKASASPSGCFVGPRTLQISGNTSCTVTFQKRAFFRRSTQIAFVANAPVFVIIKPESGPDQQQLVSAGRCFGSAVGRAGGTMQVFGTNATVQFRETQCPPE